MGSKPVITDDTKILSQIINSQGISNHLCKDYPKVHDLLQWDFKRTVGALCACGAFQLFEIDQKLQFEQHGSDNFKTWFDYKKGIQQYLKTINDDWRLEQARTSLADEIHNVHYKKFPKWPAVGDTTQKSTVFLDTTSSYPCQQWYVGWSCVGYIMVFDWRRNEDTYYTDFSGKPALKILFCNEYKMKEFEELASKDMQAARTFIQGQFRADHTLAWQNFTSQ